MAIKKCQKCGQLFEGRGHTCFCQACRETDNMEKKICPYCGKEFMPRTIRQVTCRNKACIRANSDKLKALALEEKRSVKIYNMRRCHDCGLPTTNYRCAKCWAKIRSTHTYDEEVDI